MSDWIAVDWGRDNLRAWAMRDGQVMAEASSSQGAAQLAPEEFEDALLGLVGGWAGQGDVIACGMVGGRDGWVEAPWNMTPCPPLAAALITAPARHAGLKVRIIPGVAQADPADVMRGTETRVAGFLRLNPRWDGTLCLPSLHTTWVQVSAGEIVSFRSFMTGEGIAALAGHTLLRHSLEGEGCDEDEKTFSAALADMMAAPASLMQRLSVIHAENLLYGLSPARARVRLSAYMIGAELVAARGWWLGAQVAVVGTGLFAQQYVQALSAQGVMPGIVRDDTATLAGLIAAHEAAAP